MIPKKRGQLSLDEEKFIKESISKMTIEDIASHINRSTKPIKRFIEENKLLATLDMGDDDDKEILRYRLHIKPFWSEIKKQFDNTSGELEYFENVWVSLLKQFREDVLPAEELQIKQFITIDILINRSMKERKRHIAETEKLQKAVDKEYEKKEELRDKAYLMNVETQLSFARNSIANYTNEYTKLLNEQQKISKDLKATREQRIKRIEDGKSSWIGLIRMLEDEDIREREGREMEILNLSTLKSISNLQKYHEYNNNEIDRPFLTPESVMLDTENLDPT
jgi:hypothetical protein